MSLESLGGLAPLQELKTRTDDLPDATHPRVRTCLKNHTMNPGSGRKEFRTDKQPTGKALKTAEFGLEQWRQPELV